jgi:hypothetical protein
VILGDGVVRAGGGAGAGDGMAAGESEGAGHAAFGGGVTGAGEVMVAGGVTGARQGTVADAPTVGAGSIAMGARSTVVPGWVLACGPVRFEAGLEIGVVSPVVDGVSTAGVGGPGSAVDGPGSSR